MIKTSHEVPLCLLEWSLDKMDYQYALVHLLESDKEYRNHFLKCKEMGIEIYLDNSLHELGYAMNNKALLKWIDILKPSTFFIPDVWENHIQSIINAKYWSGIELPEETTKTAVIQAQTLNEAFLCTQTYKDLGYKKIAYSYGASYYNDVCVHPNKNIGKALGRVYVISTLYNQKVLTPSDRVHLLGCALPQEFGWYQGIDCIESIDTSNPIMAAIDGNMYDVFGLTEKPKSNMNNCFNIGIENIDFDLLEANLTLFKNINNLQHDRT
jgi:hypothetical protein